MSHPSAKRGTVGAIATIAAYSGLVLGVEDVTAQERPFEYDYTEEAALAQQFDLDNPDPEMLRTTFAKRRERVLSSIPDGAMLVHSVEWVQPRRLEFQVPHSDNHDFIFLTGLEGLQSVGSALLLVPTPEKAWVVLFTSADPDFVRQVTGIEDVRPYVELEEELSVAMTDFRDWRITQIRRWPLAAALSHAWGRDQKTLYLNYPRFFRLGMPEPPRLELFKRFERFSPEMELLDAADLLDPVRMLHDGYGLANLRRAVDITGEGIIEALSGAEVGMTEREVMEAMDFVYRYRGADLGFPTSVARSPINGRQSRGPRIPEGFIQYVPRSGGDVFQSDDIVHTDTGAEFNHYSADLQRNVPISGRLKRQAASAVRDRSRRAEDRHIPDSARRDVAGASRSGSSDASGRWGV